MSGLSDEVKEKWLYGSNVPYAEAAWARGCPSPYYRESHRQLRRAMRAWVDKVCILLDTIDPVALISRLVTRPFY